MKSSCGAVRLNDIDDALEVFPPTDEEAIIQVENVEEQVGDFFSDAFREWEESKSKEKGSEWVALLCT